MKAARTSRYKDVTTDKSDGITYTPENLADFVAIQIVSQLPTGSSSTLKVLDPALGKGALLVSLLNKLRQRGFEEVDVYGFETDESTLKTAGDHLQDLFPRAKLYLSTENFLNFVRRSTQDENGLFAVHPPLKFDLIIANPPYVRTQILGSDAAQEIARQYGLAGRVDLYYAFILAMGWVLRRHGTAGIIVSNRFMTTKSGSSVRKAILENLSVRHVWDLGDTKLFDAAVLPAVLLVHPKADRSPESVCAFTSIYETNGIPSASAHDPIDALRHTGTVSVEDGRRFRVRHGILNLQAHEPDVWSVTTDSSDAWLATVKKHTWGRFAEIGSIRVGIKTCADKVFIRSDWTTLPKEQRPELLLPVTTHHVARRFKPEPQTHAKVVYPHEVVNGQRKAADLNLYPKTKAYLESYRNILSSRKYVTEAGRQWYEIWVPQDPRAWSSPKLVFRDISELPTFWIDQEGTVVNGDCYWLANRLKEQEELLWLALAVSNSTFIETFYDHSFNNKLYSGRRRFITQYVERFPLPNPANSLSRELIVLSKKIYDLTPSIEALSLQQVLDEMVWKAFGVSIEEVDRQRDLKLSV